ncbi:hypothetical protein GPECTOR_16g739 [Gonium pectorale]|uniref:BTB domain-containing protein n=1 Tax=Gonium pectorale TaxID=33097 RepID=A0A150GL91_GONPE|nr:hypothetical protein GPECTOR_16g739 [Gonium pectorale]|eukprot:KXZ50564.1 hypothetical protein GPECTOR_16g739 [Gonium pectorale]
MYGLTHPVKLEADVLASQTFSHAGLVSAPPIGACDDDVPPPVPDELLPPSEELLRGQLAAVRLPVGNAAPTQSAWCAVSNLIAVALSPEPGSSVAQILVLEPSHPEDCTALELPMAGPGDHVSSLEWSWPGQRRALLSATASGRVVVWTQPSQQGQDESVFPRCIDDWHGQLLLDAGDSAASGSGGAGSKTGGPQVKVEPGGAAAGVVATGAHVQVKVEPGADGADSGGGAVADQSAHLEAAAGAHGAGHGGPWRLPALAGVCWLRQPAGGRAWSTAALGAKRLDSSGPEGGGGGGGAGSGENFDSLFSEPAVAGAVPHWARPHQLTAAVLTADGVLTLLWALASKLPNTLSWHRSRPLHVPAPPPVASAAELPDGADGGDAAAPGDGGGGAGGGALPPEWRLAHGSMAALHDGTLSLAVVYDRRRDGVYVYGMRGNPTLGGSPVGQPGAAVPPAAPTATSAAAAPTVSFQAALALREGVSARQCRLHVSGCATRRLFVLGQESVAGAAAGAGDAGAIGSCDREVAPVAVVASFRAESPDAGGGAKAAAGGGVTTWRCERYSQLLLARCGGGDGGGGRCEWEPPAAAGPPDMSLLAGGRALPCHRSVLAARCEALRRRLPPPGADGGGSPVLLELPDADPNATAITLHALYEGGGDGAAAAASALGDLLPAPLAAATAALAEQLGLGELAAAAAAVAAAVGPRLSALRQLHAANGGGSSGGGAPPQQPTISPVPGAPVGPVSEAAVIAAAKHGELPKPLLLRSLQSLFPGPFHLHCGRTKGLTTPAALAQTLRQESLQAVVSLPKEAIMERYRALGLQAQLTDPRVAPHAAARSMWMSFRGPAPPPELHGHVLSQAAVSSRQRQRWRRQRGAALALGASAPLWSHTQGVLPDCLTGAPLPPGTSWSLEGASAGGAVTAAMGPGVGPAGGRHGLPPLLAALQRAWVCCAAPAELGSPWRRARLGQELDLQY